MDSKCFLSHWPLSNSYHLLGNLGFSCETLISSYSLS